MNITVKIPEGFKFVRLGAANTDDYSLSKCGTTLWITKGWYYNVIVKETRFKWPECIPDGTWAFKNNLNMWYLASEKPRFNGLGWLSTSGELQRIIDKVFKVSWPDCDWEDSLMRKGETFVEVELPTIPKGYVFDRLDCPIDGELVLETTGKTRIACNWTSLCIIVKRALCVPPEIAGLFKSGCWFAKDDNGSWYAYDSEPVIGSGGWNAKGVLDRWPSHVTKVQMPDCDWKDSLIRNV